MNDLFTKCLRVLILNELNLFKYKKETENSREIAH